MKFQNSKLKFFIKKIINIPFAKRKLVLLDKMCSEGLPKTLRTPLIYLITGKRDEIATHTAYEAEKRRSVIASKGNKRIPIWYSPKPTSELSSVEKNKSPSPGRVLEFTMERIARTGKNEKWGTFIHLLVREFKCKHGLELGSCAGISAMYLSSSPFLKNLITIEGSTELSKIAETSLKSRPNVTVVNSLFDEAIKSKVASSPELFDFAFIDGHHEKIATIHYFNCLVPYLKEGALIIFDDVSWSYDMREAWNILSTNLEFSHTIDLGTIGICIMKTKESKSKAPVKWDLKSITGGHSIGNPKGWKE
jgi:predicted O-methyltransferase YrrM